jgi:hypothetical protein
MSAPGIWLMHQASGCAIGLAANGGSAHVTLLPLHRGDRIGFGSRQLAVLATSGHTDGCLSFVLDDQSIAFTRVALLVRGCGRCDFEQGNAHTLVRSISDQILALPQSCLLDSGHDDSGRGVTSVAEEQAFNARLGGIATERDCVGFMDNLHLPHPHRIAVAWPGNLRCGRPCEEMVGESWPPVCFSNAGLPELAPGLVASHRRELALLDVRCTDEFHGPDGRIPGSQLIPSFGPSCRQGRRNCPPIDRWWWSAMGAAVRPWPPTSCRHRASGRWPTCMAASAAGTRKASPSTVRWPLEHRLGPASRWRRGQTGGVAVAPADSRGAVPGPCRHPPGASLNPLLLSRSPLGQGLCRRAGQPPRSASDGWIGAAEPFV